VGFRGGEVDGYFVRLGASKVAGLECRSLRLTEVTPKLQNLQRIYGRGCTIRELASVCGAHGRSAARKCRRLSCRGFIFINNWRS
jgi:hypothetical protein